MRTDQIHGLWLLLAAGLAAEGSFAQTYPTKPIRVHTAGAGGGSDVVTRIVVSELSAPLGQSVVVENRPAGVVLVAGVAKAPPDGYTLLVTGGGLWIAPLLAEVPYDPIRDFAPIMILTRTPNLLVVTPTLPVKTVADLIRLAKARPGELNYSTGSNGSSSHTAGELFKSLAGIRMERISYKDQSTENADLMSGQCQISFGVGSYVPLIKVGKLRALASGGSKRAILFPDLPTIGETLPGYISEVLNGFWATGKTPDAIVRRLNVETARVLEKPEVRERLLKVGVEPAGGAPELLNEYIKSETARLGKVMRAAEGK